MKVFFDSSAYAKRFVEEPGSGAVEELCRNASEILLSAIAVTEIARVLRRARREGRITGRQYDRAKQAFLEELEIVLIVDLSHDVLMTSFHVIEKTFLRSLDAIPVASATVCGVDLFVSSDFDQLEAAKRLGIATNRI